MNQFALNLLLALIWTFLAGSFTFQSLLFGLVLGYFALALLRPVEGSEVYVRGVWGIGRLILTYALELTRASIHLAGDILRPHPRIRGGFFRFDASTLSPTKTVLLSNLLSLTPGTLTVDIDDDGDSLYIHTLYANQLERSRKGVQLYADLIEDTAPGPATSSDEEG